ncbi:MAG TPA: LuxR C-terminal-related transcriptional regulator [Actinocrinis sp.]|uniref:helix-turn-helix transcriptional regulator n=1 Tax=Actinocrinis sp. TaxID=1920516 RepID=UPI002DDDB51D|nr:LuxR C-terminal-related transcriptional regulator [Actinocrinis sp.]HEV2345700.1 LuxR C-terminal-related transcriptional regulator [Actinocrinis sp.]
MNPSATRAVGPAGDRALAESWPFVGRVSELAALGRALAGGGAVKGAVVCGPAGIGKSRLARQAAARYESAAGAPWFLRGSDAARPTAIGMLGGAAGSAVPPSAGAPRLLVLDDADLLDDVSALVLEQWVSADRVRLLATLRAGARLPDALGALLASGLLSRVDLAPLGERDVAELLAGALGGEVSPGTVREIHRLSAGNSLFIRELLLDAASAGTLRRADDGVWLVERVAARSSGLAELLETRLAGVSGPQRAALELVALAPGVGLRLLLGLVEPPVVEALERRGLIEVDREDRRLPTRVHHPLYRELIARSTPVSARLGAARRLADALEATGLRRAEDLVRWAVWRLDGGGTPDRAKMAAAARYAAAVRAEAGVRERLAAAAFEQRREVGDGLLLYEAMVDAGRSEAAQALLDSLGALAASDHEQAALAAARAHRISWSTGRLDEGLAILEDASRAVSQAQAAAQLAANHGMLLAVTGRFDAAISELEPQLHAPWPQVRALAAAGAAMAYPLVGRFRAGLDAFDLAMAERAPDDDVAGTAPSLCALAARALCDYGDPSTALTRARAAIDDTLDRGDVVGQAWTRAGLASVCLGIGDLPAAAAQAAESGRLFEELPHDPSGRLWCLATGLSAAAQRGDRAAAQRLADALSTLPVPPQLRALSTEVVRAWSWHDYACGKGDAAGQRLAQAADAWADEGMVAPAVTGALDLFRLRHLDAATRVLDRVAIPDDWPLGACIRQLIDAAAAGKPTALREAADALHALGFTLYAAEAYAAAALASGEPAGNAVGRTSRTASRALSLAAECDARTPLLRHLGPLRALTPRERQIAECAADGLSNRQIADRLRLSERTVENHLGRIYGKLGVAGRSELGEALHRDRHHT